MAHPTLSPQTSCLVLYLHSQWDDYFKCVYTNAIQSKVSAIKEVIFAAGFNRHVDFFLNFAEYLASLIVSGRSIVYENGSPNFLFPSRNSKAPHHRI